MMKCEYCGKRHPNPFADPCKTKRINYALKLAELIEKYIKTDTFIDDEDVIVNMALQSLIDKAKEESK